MNDKYKNLRKQAENKYSIKDVRIEDLSQTQIKDIIYNLEIHKIELELQNKELEITQNNLVKSRDRYYNLFESAPIGFIAVTKELKIENVNSVFCDLIHTEKGDVLHKDIRKFINPDYQDVFYFAKQKLFRSGTKQIIEIKLNKTKGQTIWVRCEFSMLDDSEMYLISFNDIDAQKKAELDLKNSEQLYREVLENITDTVLLTDSKFDFTYVCPNVSYILGYNQEEVYRLKSLFSLLGNNISSKIDTSNQIAEEFEHVIFDKSGIKKTVLISIKQIDIKFGQYLIAMHDITQRKEAELAIQKSEERIRLALEGASDGVWDWNIQTNEIYYSPAWKKMVGYEDHEIENDFSVWEKLVDPEGRKIAWENLNNYIEGKQDFFRVEFKMKHKNGDWIDVLSRAVLIFEEDKPYRVVGTHVNITKERKASEILQKALNKSEKQQKEITELLNATHSILENNDFKIIAKQIFDACKNAIGAKAGYVALLSDSGEENELLFLDDGGLPCSVDPSLPMPVRGLRAEAYSSGKVVYDNDFMNSEFVKYMPKGHMDLPNILFAPLKIKNKTVGVLSISHKERGFTVRDAQLASAFSEYASIALQNSRIINDLKQTANELKNLNRTKDRLFSIIGHDLKSPLSNIIGFSQLLKENYNRYSEDKKIRYNDLIYRSANSLNDLLNNLLQWSRTQQNKVTLNQKEINLNELIITSLKLLDTNIQTKNIEIINLIDGNRYAYADKDMITTVFRNILSNAVKFTPKGGKIFILNEIKDNFCIIEIKDTGIGMSSKKMEKLFDYEDNYTSSGTDGEKGTGLGLVICKEFIELNSGKLLVESEEGKGSTFYIYIPLTSGS